MVATWADLSPTEVSIPLRCKKKNSTQDDAFIPDDKASKEQ